MAIVQKALNKKKMGGLNESLIKLRENVVEIRQEKKGGEEEEPCEVRYVELVLGLFLLLSLSNEQNEVSVLVGQ